jgi:hypothetical protein
MSFEDLYTYELEKIERILQHHIRYFSNARLKVIASDIVKMLADEKIIIYSKVQEEIIKQRLKDIGHL